MYTGLTSLMTLAAEAFHSGTMSGQNAMGRVACDRMSSTLCHDPDGVPGVLAAPFVVVAGAPDIARVGVVLA